MDEVDGPLRTRRGEATRLTSIVMISLARSNEALGQSCAVPTWCVVVHGCPYVCPDPEERWDSRVSFVVMWSERDRSSLVPLDFLSHKWLH